MRSPVVVGTDGSPCAETAIEWAAAEAARRDRKLHILYAAMTRDYGLAYYRECGEGQWLTKTGNAILARATELAAKIAPDLTVTTELAFASPGAALRAQENRAAAIVVGHRGLGGFVGLLLGSTSLTLAGRTRCPLIVVRGAAGGEQREVLAGVELSDGGADGVLGYAFEAAKLRNAWVRVVHTWNVPPAQFNAAFPVTVREALAAAQDRLADVVAPWRARYPELRVVEEAPPGRPVAELIERSERADLLVVGSHRKGGGPHFGSVGHGVIHHAACPVAVVPAGTTTAGHGSGGE